MAGKEKAQVPGPTGEGTDEEVRRRAYEISQSPEAGTAEENWHRAEREVEQRSDSASART